MLPHRLGYHVLWRHFNAPILAFTTCNLQCNVHGEVTKQHLQEPCMRTDDFKTNCTKLYGYGQASRPAKSATLNASCASYMLKRHHQTSFVQGILYNFPAICSEIQVGEVSNYIKFIKFIGFFYPQKDGPGGCSMIDHRASPRSVPSSPTALGKKSALKKTRVTEVGVSCDVFFSGGKFAWPWIRSTADLFCMW